MLTAQQAKEIADEVTGRKNISSLMGHIRKRAEVGFYDYTMQLKLFSEYTCSPEELEGYGFKVKIYFSEVYKRQFIEINWEEGEEINAR
jgi:hypothetical protein